METLTHKVRMTVDTAHKRGALDQALTISWRLYNAALEERSGAWSKIRTRITKNDQFKSITALAGDPSLAGLPVNLLRWPLAKLDLAYEAFFKRVKAGLKPGHPRYRAFARWDTFGYTDRQCWSLSETRRRLDLSRIGSFRLKLHRPIEGEIRSLQIKREGRRWFALITVRVADAAVHRILGSSVGLDMGTTHLATLSSGERIVNVRTMRRLAPRIAEAQRALARGRRGSKRRARVRETLRRLRRHEGNCRTTHLHQEAASLTRRFETIVIEALKPGNMMRSASGTLAEPGTGVARKSGLNRSIGDAAWGRFAEFLTYKAARAGGSVVRVNPRNTSNECSRCHAITPTRIGDLYVCPHCGLAMDRDHNAALVILSRGVVAPVAEAA